MIRTRCGRTRRKVSTWNVSTVPASNKTRTTGVSPDAHQVLQERVVRVEKQLQRLEKLFVSQQLAISTVHDATQPLHRILLTDTASSRMELPALHHFVVSRAVCGSRRVPVRSSHTTQVGDRLTDGRNHTTVVRVTSEEIETAHPVTFGAAQALATVPAQYALPALYYVYNLSDYPMHVVSGACAISIRPTHSVTLSLTHAGFRLVHS
jgi:hypothetical protein